MTVIGGMLPLRALFDDLDDAIVVFDPHRGQRVYANAAFARLAGEGGRPVAGPAGPPASLHADHHPAYRRFVDDLVTGRGFVDGVATAEWELEDREGERVPVTVKVERLRDVTGDVVASSPCARPAPASRGPGCARCTDG